MTLTSRELLERLLEETPMPAGVLDVDALLATFEQVVTRRAALLAQLAPPLALIDADRPLLAELARRDAAWQDLLGSALDAVGQQRRGVSGLRAYAPAR